MITIREQCEKITLKPPSENGHKTKGTSTYSSTELQITRAKLLICLYHDSSTQMIFFYIYIFFNVSIFSSNGPPDIRAIEGIRPAVLVLKRHVKMYQQCSSNIITVLLGLQYTDNVITKPSTTVYKYNKKTGTST